MLLNHRTTIENGRVNNRTTRRAAFTLMEILVVVAILVALAVVGGVSLLNYYSSAQDDVAGAKASEIAKFVETYQLKHGAPPQNLMILTQPDPKFGNRPYVQSEDQLKDPWGQVYQIDASPSNKFRGQKVEIFTVKPGGENIRISN